MNCNDGKCNEIREGIVHEENSCLKSDEENSCLKSDEENSCLKSDKKNTYIELIRNKTHIILNIKHKGFYILVIATAILISSLDILTYYFTDSNLEEYHKCIANTIRENGTINISQFTTCSTNDSQSPRFLIAFMVMAVIAVFFICHNIALRIELNSINVKLNKK